MPNPNSPFILPILLTLILLSIPTQTNSQTDDQNNSPFVNYCYGENYTSPSPYSSNLHLLLSNLISSTPKSPSHFLLTNSTSPQIFGLAQCLPPPYLPPSLCSLCLNLSAAAFANNRGCGLKKSFANRARNCLIRYSDRPFYTLPEEGMIVFSKNAENASDSFSRRASGLVRGVMAEAAAAESRFAVGGTNDSVVGQDVYGMGWCSMDLSSGDCAQCLGMVWERIAGKDRGEAAFVSCALRYETFQFYSVSVVATAPSPEPLSRRKQRSDGIAPAMGEGGEWFDLI